MSLAKKAGNSNSVMSQEQARMYLQPCVPPLTADSSVLSTGEQCPMTTRKGQYSMTEKSCMSRECGDKDARWGSCMSCLRYVYMVEMSPQRW